MTRPFPIAALLIGLASAAHGSDDAGGPWSFNGFGTLGLVHSSEDRADYLPDPLRLEGPGRSGSWSAGVDSRAALQVGFHPTSRVSAVVQVVLEQAFDGDYEPVLEWANLEYRPSPNLRVRGGRIALGNFLTSDYRKVGYAMPWVRPPAEVYRLLAVTNNDGVDITYRTHHGEVTYTAQAYYGRSDVDLDGNVDAPNTWGAVGKVEWQAFTLQASYAAIKVNWLFLDPLWEGFQAFGPEGAAVLDRYDSSGAWIGFTSAGIRYDPGTWLVMGEWGRRDDRNDFGSSKAWYLSAGYQWQAFTPYLTYARAWGGHREVRGLTPEAYPEVLQPAVAELNGALLDAQRQFVPSQSTVSAGARWDVWRNVSAKVQYDRINVQRDSAGTFGNFEPGFLPRRADVVSLAVDFVF